MKKYPAKQPRKILLLTANPKETSKLRLEEEVRRISDALERSKKREDFDLHIKPAATYRHVRRALLDHEPEIVHFCGHGAGEDGIAFENENGDLKLIHTSALTTLFELAQTHVKCVVLNACFAEVQANEIVRHIEYVIGMKAAVKDNTALSFAEGFYDALGAGKAFHECFQFGVNSIQSEDLASDLIPVMRKKGGAESEKENPIPQNGTKAQAKNQKARKRPENITLSVSPPEKRNMLVYIKKYWQVLVIASLATTAVFLAAAAFYLSSTPPLTGSYVQEVKGITRDFGPFKVDPVSSIITIFPDPVDGKLSATSITQNLVYFQKEDTSTIAIGTYMVVWKYKEIPSSINTTFAVTMEGHLVKRFGLDELKSVDLNALGINSKANLDTILIQKIQVDYGTAKATFTYQDNLLRREVYFNEKESEKMSEKFHRLRYEE